MPKLTIAVPHSLAQDEALSRIQSLLSGVKNQFNDSIRDLDEKWEDYSNQFRFRVAGFSVSGTLTVDDSRVMLTGKLPYAALPFKKKIESTIKEYAVRQLA